MIIYGSRSKEIGTESLMDKCSHCGTSNSTQLSVFQKYAHVFWIPFFPIGKTGVAICSHCKKVTEKGEFDASLNERYESLKSGAKAPIWIWSGLALLAVLIVWGVFTSKQYDAKKAQYIASPQKGDVYSIKIKVGQFTIYKVEDLVGDTVFFRLGQYETNLTTGIPDLKKRGAEAYGEDIMPLLKSDLNTMLEAGDIIDIER